MTGAAGGAALPGQVGWQLRGDSEASSEHRASEAGTLSMAAECYVPGKIHRDKDDTGSFWEGELMGEDQQGAWLGTDVAVAQLKQMSGTWT